MKFVSRYANNKITLNSGTRSAVIHPSGSTEFVDNGDFFNIEFQRKTLSSKEIESAIEQIFGVGTTPGVSSPHNQAFGSMPARDEGLISIDEAIAAGYSDLAHGGYDVYQNLGSYDTEDPNQCPPHLKEEVELFLLGHSELGTTYVRVDNYNLTPPWPTFPAPDATVNIERLIAFAEAGGLIGAALTYMQTSVGYDPAIIEAFSEAYEKQVEEDAERRALAARV